MLAQKRAVERAESCCGGPSRGCCILLALLTILGLGLCLALGISRTAPIGSPFRHSEVGIRTAEAHVLASPPAPPQFAAVLTITTAPTVPAATAAPVVVRSTTPAPAPAPAPALAPALASTTSAPNPALFSTPSRGTPPADPAVAAAAMSIQHLQQLLAQQQAKQKAFEAKIQDSAKKSAFPADIQRQDAVRAAIKHAWHGYAAWCFGKDEINPVTGQCGTQDEKEIFITCAHMHHIHLNADTN